MICAISRMQTGGKESTGKGIIAVMISAPKSIQQKTGKGNRKIRKNPKRPLACLMNRETNDKSKEKVP